MLLERIYSLDSNSFIIVLISISIGCVCLAYLLIPALLRKVANQSHTATTISSDEATKRVHEVCAVAFSQSILVRVIPSRTVSIVWPARQLEVSESAFQLLSAEEFKFMILSEIALKQNQAKHQKWVSFVPALSFLPFFLFMFFAPSLIYLVFFLLPFSMLATLKVMKFAYNKNQMNYPVADAEALRITQDRFAAQSYLRKLDQSSPFIQSRIDALTP